MPARLPSLQPLGAQTRSAPSFLTATLRIFDLSLGRMLWSRGTVFMALVVGLPVVLALILRRRRGPAALGGGIRVDGQTIVGPDDLRRS